AAARRAGFRLRSHVLAQRPHPHLRRDDERGETWPAAEGQRTLAPGARVSQARGGLSCSALIATTLRRSASISTGRSACRSVRTATSTAMCAMPPSTRHASPAPLPPPSPQPPPACPP